MAVRVRLVRAGPTVVLPALVAVAVSTLGGPWNARARLDGSIFARIGTAAALVVAGPVAGILVVLILVAPIPRAPIVPGLIAVDVPATERGLVIRLHVPVPVVTG